MAYSSPVFLRVFARIFMKKFSRIDRLPPYTLGIVNDLKHKARRKGEDIIDFGLGNPDQSTPKHIVDKLCEAAVKSGNHRYSLSRGIYKLRLAITDWYKNRFNIDSTRIFKKNVFCR